MIYHSTDRIQVTGYGRSIVTMALSYIISEIKRDIGRKSRCLIPHLHWAPPLGGSCRNIVISIWYRKTRTVWLPDGETTLKTCVAVSTQYQRVSDRRTDGQTDILPHYTLCLDKKWTPRTSTIASRNISQFT